jgi:cerevisin
MPLYPSKGSSAVVVAGLNWILNRAKSTGRPSVVNLSIGTSAHRPTDDAVTALTNAGIHVVVAAGNDNRDASLDSPGRVPSVITVGNTNMFDFRSEDSNHGSAIDIFAPGDDIVSAWKDSDDVWSLTNWVSIGLC